MYVSEGSVEKQRLVREEAMEVWIWEARGECGS